MANTLKIKRGTAATIPQGQLAEPLFTTDTYDLYIGKGAGGNQRIQNYIASGTSSQFLKGDGSLDSTTYQATSEKGQNNGYASLDAGGKIPAAQLPSSVIEYKGTWNASTNTPTLADGTGDAGDVYIVSVGGTQNLGSGSITFAAGDWVMYNGTIWEKSINSNAVASVNGQTGVVVLTTTNISEGTNLYYTDTRARIALSATSPVQYNNSTGVISILDASASQSGVVTTGTQTFAGAKSFSSSLTVGTGTTGTQYFANTSAEISYSATTGLWRFNNLAGGSASTTYYQFVADGTPILSMLKNGESTFSANVIGAAFLTSANSYFQLGYGANAASRSWQIKNDELDPGDLNIMQSTTRTGNTYSTKFRIKPDGILVFGNGTNSFEASGYGYVDGIFEATTIKKTAGTSSQFLKADGSVDSNTYLTTSSASSSYVPYTGATTNVNIGTNSMTAFNFYASSTYYIDSYNYFMKSILELRDNATSTKRLYITADTSESLISTVNTVPLKLRATSGVTEQVVLNTNGTINFTGAATFSSSVTATSESTVFKEGFIVKATTTSAGGSQPAYTYYTAAGSKRWSTFLNVGDDKFHIAGSANTELFTIQQNGNVGIGTTSPATLDSGGVNLQIKDRSSLFQLGVVNSTYLGNNVYYDGTWKRIVSGYGSMIRLLNDNNGISFYTFGTAAANTSITFTEAMHIKNDGNVGIGTVTPSDKLTVTDASTYTFNIGAASGGAGAVLYTLGSAALTFATNGSANERMRITSGGNVVVGDTSDYSVRMHVAGVGATTSTGNGSSNIVMLLRDTTAGAINVGAGIGFAGNDGANTGVTFATINGRKENSTSGNYASYLAFQTRVDGGALTERMRITSGGQISQTTSIADWSHVISNASSTSPNGIIIQYTNANKNGTGNQFLYCTDNFGATLRFEVRSNGGISNYQANNTNLSDIRTKKDIVSLESYWDKFKAIEIVKFKYKDQTHDDYNIGLIAQQVENVAPEFVDVDGWGETPEDGVPYKSVYTADLHHATIKVLQEAMAKIEEQQAQIEELKSKLN